MRFPFLIYMLVYLCMPSINLEYLMDSTQSEKSFIFLLLMMPMPVFIMIQNLGIVKANQLKIRYLDILLLVWSIYVLANGYLHNVSHSLLLLEFYGLFILYATLRQISTSTIVWIYTALIIGGFFQAIYGNLQLWGFYPSHLGSFKIVGSYFNPGPYAGYISSTFTIALGFFLFDVNFPALEKVLKKYNLNKSNTTKFVLQSLMFFIVIALAGTHSRAAFLALLISSIYLICTYYKNQINKLLVNHLGLLKHKLSIIGISIILISCLFTSLYSSKKNSANGRLLIWEVSLNMINDRPIFGYGFDQFKTHYLNYQKSFFEQPHGFEQEMLAGEVNYAFNEPLQHAVENGIIGLALAAGIFFIILTSGRRSTRVMMKSDNDMQTIPKFDSNIILSIAKAGVINIFIFSLFSYPSQILPIKTALVLYLATIAKYMPKTDLPFLNFLYREENRRLFYKVKISILLIIIPIISIGFGYLNSYARAYRDWRVAYDDYIYGIYDNSIKHYEKAYPFLKNNGYFLTNYGKALSESGKHCKAVLVLNKAINTYPNPIVYTTIGNSYKMMQLYEKAEKAYLNAWYMAPGRFYPKYLLAKLYHETGKTEKAVSIANELLHKRIKIESNAIIEIKKEMIEIINQSTKK